MTSIINLCKKLYKKKTTVRHAIGAAPEDMCTGISDYSSQEVRAIACIGRIKRMIEAFFDAEVYNPFLVHPETGEKYKNPDSDMHTLAATGLYPELQSTDKWDLIKAAKKDMGGWNRRTRGKICGFTVIYGGSANRISVALQVELELAEKLLSNYFELFPELKTYIDTVSTKAKYQKWVECPVTNRRYFVGETNAKGLGDDNTVQRKACNTLIQGVSAIMTKKAAWYVDQEFEELNTRYSADLNIGKHGRIVALVHDEIVSYIPGQGKIIDMVEKEGIWTPKFEYKPISYEYARAQEHGMKKAMDELLHPLIPGFPSKADWLGRPVSGSCKALWVINAWVSLRSLISRQTEINRPSSVRVNDKPWAKVEPSFLVAIASPCQAPLRRKIGNTSCSKRAASSGL